MRETFLDIAAGLRNQLGKAHAAVGMRALHRAHREAAYRVFECRQVPASISESDRSVAILEVVFHQHVHRSRNAVIDRRRAFGAHALKLLHHFVVDAGIHRRAPVVSPFS